MILDWLMYFFNLITVFHCVLYGIVKQTMVSITPRKSLKKITIKFCINFERKQHWIPVLSKSIQIVYVFEDKICLFKEFKIRYLCSDAQVLVWNKSGPMSMLSVGSKVNVSCSNYNRDTEEISGKFPHPEGTSIWKRNTKISHLNK